MMIHRSIIGARYCQSSSSTATPTTATAKASTNRTSRGGNIGLVGESATAKSPSSATCLSSSYSQPLAFSAPDLKPIELARLSLYLIQKLWPSLDIAPGSAQAIVHSFERIIRHSQVSQPIVYTALIYLYRLFKKCNRQIANGAEVHLFGIAVMLAQKVLIIVSHGLFLSFFSYLTFPFYSLES